MTAHLKDSTIEIVDWDMDPTSRSGAAGWGASDLADLPRIFCDHLLQKFQHGTLAKAARNAS